MRLAIAALTALAASACQTPEGSSRSKLRPEVRIGLAKLERLATACVANAESEDAEAQARGMDQEQQLQRDTEVFAASIQPADILSLVSMASEEKWRRSPFPMHILMVLVGRYDVAAELLAPPLSRSENPEYIMWKSWEMNFGKREDYLEMSRLMGEAFLELHDRDPDSRAVIEKLFHGRIEEARRRISAPKKSAAKRQR